MKTILATTDFSSAANNALAYAADLAQHYGSTLLILHSYQSPVYYTVDMPFAIIEETEKQVLADVNAQMKQTEHSIRSKHPGLTIHSRVEKGLIGETAAVVSKESKAEITVAATTGASGLERILLGSSAMDIIKHATNMVLLVPNEARFRPFEKIVFATDLNESHLMQHHQLQCLVENQKTELCFLFIDASIHSDSESLDQQMSELIKKHVSHPFKSGFVSTDQDVENGITGFLQESHGDLLVMVTEPFRFPESIFHRSHTKKISNKTPKPMLALKPVRIPLPT